MRPPTLAAVAEMALDGDSFGRCLANFLDEFYLRPFVEALAPAPPRMKDRLEKGEVWDAYLAATAEELARKYDLPHPGWIYSDDRKLRLPWFATEMQAMRAVLLLESPAGFRSRNLFVSENALTRA